MNIDCTICPAREVSCEGCLVALFHELRAPDLLTPRSPARARPAHARVVRSDTALDVAEQQAVAAFRAAGLVSATTARTARAECRPIELAHVG